MNLTFLKEPPEAPLNDCEYWGENRADELWIDVGCVLQHSFCDHENCKDYRKCKT